MYKQNKIKMNEKYLVFINDLHEYDIILEINGDVKTYVLSKSHNLEWAEHVRGKFCFKLTENGNGIKFNRSITKLNYSEYEQINILISFEKHRYVEFAGNIGVKIIKIEKEINL